MDEFGDDTLEEAKDKAGWKTMTTTAKGIFNKKWDACHEEKSGKSSKMRQAKR